MIRAKLKVVAITDHADWSARTVRLQPCYDMSIPEDRRFAMATPSGSFEMVVDNPAALAQLKLGQTFYLDLTPVES